MLPSWTKISIIRLAIGLIINQLRAVRLYVLEKVFQGLDRVPYVTETTCYRSQFEMGAAQILNIPPPTDRQNGYFLNALRSRSELLIDSQIDQLLSCFHMNVRSWQYFEIIGSSIFGEEAFKSLVSIVLPPNRKRAPCQAVQQRRQVRPCLPNRSASTIVPQQFFHDNPDLLADSFIADPDPPTDLDPIPIPTPNPTIYASVINSNQFVPVVPADMVGGQTDYLVVNPGDRLRFYRDQLYSPLWIVFPGKLVFPDIDGTFDVPAQPAQLATDLYPAFLPDDMVFYYRYATDPPGVGERGITSNVMLSRQQYPPFDIICSSASTSSQPAHSSNQPNFATSSLRIDFITLGIILTVIYEILRFNQHGNFSVVAMAPTGNVASQSVTFDRGRD